MGRGDVSRGSPTFIARRLGSCSLALCNVAIRTRWCIQGTPAGNSAQSVCRATVSPPRGGGLPALSQLLLRRSPSSSSPCLLFLGPLVLRGVPFPSVGKQALFRLSCAA